MTRDEAYKEYLARYESVVDSLMRDGWTRWEAEAEADSRKYVSAPLDDIDGGAAT